MTEYDLHREHPDVEIMLAELRRDRGPDPLPILREAVRELAEIVANLCAYHNGEALLERRANPHSEAARENLSAARDMYESARDLAETLR